MRLRLVVFLLLVLTASVISAAALSGGPPADTVKSNDGCSCHGSLNTATVIHDVKGWPAQYVPKQQYILEVSSTNNVQPKPGLEKNQGGFLSWVSKGTFTTTPGTQAWVDVGLMQSGEHWVRHNIQGEKENGQQVWNFTWTAPEAGSGAVTLHVYVNRINSNQANSGDHWNKREFTSSEGSGSPTSVFPPPSDTKDESATTSPEDSVDTSRDPADTTYEDAGLGFVVGAAALGVVAFAARRRLR
jgi:hypothetical protein